jgi:hypothetical protein
MRVPRLSGDPMASFAMITAIDLATVDFTVAARVFAAAR